jgi:predicted hydrocarbon binding protein
VDAANKKVGLEAHLEEDDEAFYMVYTFCPCIFRSRKDTTPCCYTTVGTLQEGMRWATGGKHFRVQEVTCLNIGDAECRFKIEKHAME